MRALSFFPSAVLLILFALLCCPDAPAETAMPAGRLPDDIHPGTPSLFFIANKGQLDPRVKYYMPAGDRIFYLTSRGVTVVMVESRTSQPGGKRPGSQQVRREQPRYWAARLEFTDADPQAVPRGRRPLSSTFGYFRGSPEQWLTNVPTCAEVAYEGLWPGVDLVFTARQDRLKYTFIVHPGADPDRIRMAYSGAGISLTVDGGLMVETPAGVLVDQPPLAWQDSILSGRQAVPCSYGLAETGTAGIRDYGFRVESYDPALPLIIDPGFIVYSGFLGGSSWDEGYGIALDGAGYAYVTGDTLSLDFPATSGRFYPGGFDVFVAKINPDGTELVYSKVLGGSNDDQGNAVAVDGGGNVYVIGTTNSADFPNTLGTTYAGSNDVFLAKIPASGQGLIFSGLVGGSDNDRGEDVAVDSLGNVYITGSTRSAGFPCTGGLPFAGAEDVFVAKVNPDGTAFVYCGLLGGSSYEGGNAVAVDDAGNAYVTGSTTSHDFFGRTNAGGVDVFAAKIRADGSGLEYFGLLGGSGTDEGNGIAVDNAGNAYITGFTSSTDIPCTDGPSPAGAEDAFAARIRADGTGMHYCRLFGGSATDWGQDIAVDGKGNAYITGSTSSADFPRTGGPPHAGGDDIVIPFLSSHDDAFAVKLPPDGAGLSYSFLLGGSGNDWGEGIAVDSEGLAHIAGYTSSADFPRTAGPPHAGYTDAFVAKVRPFFPWAIFYPAMRRHE